MNRRSIGFRLTLWYAGSLAAILVLLGGGLWLALRESMYHAVDDSLRDRVQGIRRFIEQESAWLSPDEIRAEFQEHSVLGPGGDLFQVADAEGTWIYRSSPLYDEHVPVYGIADIAQGRRYENIVVRDTALRFLSQTIEVGGRRYAVQVAAPLEELEEGLAEFTWIVILVLPGVLIVATAGGYWVSRRALGPVDEITAAARAMGIQDLSRRVRVPDSGDELERLSETLNDMLARLEAAFDRMTRFTADASHELRTPLALIRATIELALRHEGDARARREALGQVLAEVERTSQLVENLLWVARADSGTVPLAKDRTDLAQIVREAAIQAAPLAEAKHQTLDRHVPETSVLVLGDFQVLRRLCLILLDNAVKYTPPHGRIRIGLERKAPMAVVSVEDTGIGIPETEQGHIFERFYRVDKARSREQVGTGLGLAIARWIVEQHGGAITVDSRPGAGTVFSASIPLAVSATHTPRPRT